MAYSCSNKDCGWRGGYCGEIYTKCPKCEHQLEYYDVIKLRERHKSGEGLTSKEQNALDDALLEWVW